jgi:hypothetical protein
LLLTALLLAAVMITACGMSPVEDLEATLIHEAEVIRAEATAIRATAEAEGARLNATMDAANSYLDHRRGVNAALLSTARAGIVPTTQVVANVFGGTPEAISQGRRWFVKTGTSDEVRASDGCTTGPRDSFTTSSPAIYATFQAFHIAAGTPLSVSWLHEGRSVHQESFDLSGNYSEVCLWFSLNPSITPFYPGAWAVQLYAEGFPLEGPMLFTIRDA